VASAWHKVVRLSLPNRWLEETTWSNLPAQLAKLSRPETAEPTVQQAAPRIRERELALA
jgi:linoleoyl-CoA desaturase